MAKMRDSYRNNPEKWKALLQKDGVVLGCYCHPGKFCHRHLLKDILEKIAHFKGYQFEYVGEIPFKRK